MRRNTAFQGTLNRPGPTPAAASHNEPGCLFRDARFFGKIKPLGRNAATPGNVANPVRVRSSFWYEAETRPAARAGEGLFRGAGSFDEPRSIERNDMMPKDVANAIRVRRSRGYNNAPQPAARVGGGSRPPYND